jgi:hypothetical protein
MIKKGLVLLSLLSLLSANNEYQEWLKSQSKDYNKYVKSLDEEFSAMLKKDWELFKSMYDPSPYKKPKPQEVPKQKKEKKVSQKEIESSPKVKIKPIKEKKLKIVSNVPKIKGIELSVNENISSDKKIGELKILTTGEGNIENIYLFDMQKKQLSSEFEILNNGIIKLKSKQTLDYEKRSLYKLQAIATNKIGDSNKVSVVIRINDLDNEIVAELKPLNIIVEKKIIDNEVIGKIDILNKNSLDSQIDNFILIGKGSNNFDIKNNGNI